MATAIGLGLDGALALYAAKDSLFSKPSDDIHTNVRIGIAKAGRTFDGHEVSDDYVGGSVPHISLWNDDGHRIGQYGGDENGHLYPGDEKDISISHSQTEPPNSNDQAKYLMLSMLEGDAVCISYISMTWPNEVKFVFFGDMAHQCKADWYYSALEVDETLYTPRCMWLDADHSGGLHFQGVGLHMSDFAPTPERLGQYNNITDSLCKSTPRFQMYPNILPDEWHSFYDPPLSYNQNLTDVDLGKVIFAKGTSRGGLQPQFDFSRRRRRRGRNVASAKGDATSRGRNPQPDRLIMSHHTSHSAKELCKSDQSYGPDFVSYHEITFCDMSTKESWPLCCEQDGIQDACFDVDAKTMRPPKNRLSRRDPASGREVPEKTYINYDEWKL